MAVLLSDKVKFRAKNIRGSKEHYIMIRVNTPRGRNNPKCVGAKKAELTELKGEIDKSTVVFGVFNMPLSRTDRTTRGKTATIWKELNAINRQDLINIQHSTKTNKIHILSKSPQKNRPQDHVMVHKNIPINFI